MSNSDEDSRLISRTKAGDNSAFADLVRKYETKVRGYCLHMLLDYEESEDAAQEVFLKAYRSLRDFDGRSSFSTWLFRITVNHCHDVRRKLSRQRTEQLTEDDGGEKRSAESAAFVEPEALNRAEYLDLVRKVFSRLSEEYRQILLLREVEEMSYEEIAEVLACSLDAVKGRLKRARVQLKEEMRHFLGDSVVETLRGED